MPPKQLQTCPRGEVNLMKMSRKLMVLAVLIAGFLPIGTGCVGGVGTTKEDMDRNFNRTVRYDYREMADDLALFFMTNRPMRASKWVID
jgi:hypothetical protein